MRKIDLPLSGEPIAFAEPQRGRRPFSYAVEAEHRSAFERAREKRRSRVCLVMLRKEQRRQFGGPTSTDGREFPLEQRLEVELFLEPQRHRGQKRIQAP